MLDPQVSPNSWHSEPDWLLVAAATAADFPAAANAMALAEDGAEAQRLARRLGSTTEWSQACSETFYEVQLMAALVVSGPTASLG